jgi:MFS transporter, PPP family, 3-phenylpropionic acid transporter
MTSSSTPPTAAPANNFYALRVAMFFAALFLIMGLHLPFLPLWLDFAGLNATEIAVITAAPLFLRVLFTPLVALRADQTGQPRRYVMLLAVAATVLAALLLGVSGFWLIFTVVFAFTLCLSTMMPLTETIAVAGVKADGLDYGRMRLWGSLAFIGVGFLGGALIDATGPSIIVWLILLASAITMLAALWLPETQGAKRQADVTTPGPSKLLTADARRLVSSRMFLVFLLAVGAIQGAHAMFYTFGALHWRTLGHSTSLIGALWALGVLAEVVLFAYSTSVVRRFGPTLLVLIGGGAAVLRWTAMAFDPGLTFLIALQLLHALTYGATHLGAIHFIARAVPEGAAGTAQALYGTVAAGMMIAAATMASGPIYRSYDGLGYVAMTVLALVGTLAAISLWRTWDGGALWRGDEPAEVEGDQEEMGPKLPIGPNL